MKLTIPLLMEICKYKKLNYEELLLSLNNTFVIFEINTRTRIQMYMAQCIHETGNFSWLKELGPDSYFKKYEFRKDLGNIYPGDGLKFKGRGFIQVTGRYNYTLCGQFLKLPLVDFPEMLEQYQYAALSSGWYWKIKNLNYYSDLRSVKMVTKLINGGYTGYSDRLKWYLHCKSVLKTM